MTCLARSRRSSKLMVTSLHGNREAVINYHDAIDAIIIQLAYLIRYRESLAVLCLGLPNGSKLISAGRLVGHSRVK